MRMGLFVCDECNVIENTALGRYWTRDVFGDGRPLCSLCAPEIGRWHGLFQRHTYDPARHEVANPPERTAP